MSSHRHTQGATSSTLPSWAESLLASKAGAASSFKKGLPLGIPGFDAVLPGGGLLRGAVNEALSSSGMHMATFLPLIVRLTKEEKTTALIDSKICWYPPAFARAGADLRHLMLVSPHHRKELLWVTEQCFASETIALTIAHIESLRDLELRRLGLMAEKGGNGCVLLRPLREVHQPAAPLRLVIRPWPGKPDKQSFHMEIARARGALPPPPIILEFDHESPLVVSATAALPLSAGGTGQAAASA